VAPACHVLVRGIEALLGTESCRYVVISKGPKIDGADDDYQH